MGPHILDFFCIEAKPNIELDGFQHGHPDHAHADKDRDRWLQERGIQVLRYWNFRLRREKQAVRDAIWQALQERAPKPLPDYCRPRVASSNTTANSSRLAETPFPQGTGPGFPGLIEPKRPRILRPCSR